MTVRIDLIFAHHRRTRQDTIHYDIYISPPIAVVTFTKSQLKEMLYKLWVLVQKFYLYKRQMSGATKIINYVAPLLNAWLMRAMSRQCLN